jgi:hypothetical protein
LLHVIKPFSDIENQPNMNKLTGNNEELVFFRLWRPSWIFLVTMVMEKFDKNGGI